MKSLRINTEVTLCRTATASKNLNRRECCCGEDIVRYTQSALDELRRIRNLIQVGNMLCIRIMDYFTIFSICQAANTSKIRPITKCNCRITHDIVIFMTCQTVNQLTDTHSFIRSRRRMRTDEHSKCIRGHFLNSTREFDVTVNRRRAGVKYKQFCVRRLFLHTLKSLLLIHLLCRRINEGHIKAIFFRYTSSINQPKRVIQNTAMTNRGASGFARELTVFSLERGINKAYFHF